MRKTIAFSDMLKRDYTPAQRKRIKLNAKKMQWHLGFARRLRTAAECAWGAERGMQIRFAKAVGLSRQVVSDYLSGKKCPTVYTLLRITEEMPESSLTRVGTLIGGLP